MSLILKQLKHSLINIYNEKFIYIIDLRPHLHHLQTTTININLIKLLNKLIPTLFPNLIKLQNNHNHFLPTVSINRQNNTLYKNNSNISIMIPNNLNNILATTTSITIIIKTPITQLTIYQIYKYSSNHYKNNKNSHK